MCLMPANPDISGIGVRIAIYLQNLLCFFPAFWSIWDSHVSGHELHSAETQSTTNLVLAFAILISCIVQMSTLGLTSYHATIVLSLSWMNNTNAFIYFLLYVHYKCQGAKPQVEPNWASWFDHVKDHMRGIVGLPPASKISSTGARDATDDPQTTTRANGRQSDRSERDANPRKGVKAIFKRFALVLGSLHLTMMGALGILLWKNPRTFGIPEASCAVDAAHLALFGSRVPFASEKLRRASLVVYSLFLLPGFNLLLPMAAFLWLYLWQIQRIKKKSNAQGTPGVDGANGTHPLSANSPVLPIFAGLALLLAVNVVFIVDIELTLRRNIGLQEGEGEETQWGFGQILAVLLVLLPLRDVVEMVLARRLGQQWNRALRERNVGMILGLVQEDVNPNVPGEDGITALEIAASQEEWRALFRIAAAIVRRGDTPAKFRDGRTALQVVISQNSLEGVQALVRADVNLDVAFSDGTTPLELAALQSKWEIVLALVNGGADVNTIFQDGQTALQHASSANEWTVVLVLLRANANFRHLFLDGRKLLRVAADAGEWKVVALLLDKGASKEDGYHNGQTLVLELAIRAEEWDMVRRLADWGPDITFPGPKSANLGIALQEALGRSQWQVVEILVEADANPDNVSRDGKSLLEAAVRAEAWGVVRRLANANHSVNVVFQSDDIVKTPLRAACSHGEWELVEFLLKKGADPNLQATGHELLEAACAAGQFKTAEFLLRAGAGRRHPGDSGGVDEPSAVEAAGTQGYLDIGKSLLDRGAGLDASEYRPALRIACAGGRLDIVDLLLDEGVDPNIRGGEHGTALQAACAEGHLDVVKLLLDRGADPNLEDGSYRTALQMACGEGHVDIVKLLLERNANPNVKGGLYGTAIRAACARGHLELVKLLLDSNADPDLDGGAYGTALELACDAGHLDVVKLLLNSGVDPNLESRFRLPSFDLPGFALVGSQGVTALQSACNRGHLEVVELLLNGGADPDLQGENSPYKAPLHAACDGGHLDIVRFLLDHHTDPNLKDDLYGSALRAPCAAGHTNVAKLLLENGADPNLEGGAYGTALQAACSGGHLDIVKLLLAHKADPNLRGGDYGIPLPEACAGGHLDIVKCLLDSHADPNLTGGEHGSALHSACAGGYLEIATLLLDGGAHLDTSGRWNETALDVAHNRGHHDIKRLLLDRGATGFV